MNLKKEREWAISTLRKIGHEPVAFELSPAGGHIKEWWRTKIRTSDALILLIYNEVSLAVYDEIETARECGTKIFVFPRDETFLLAKNGKQLSELGLSKREFERFCGFVTGQKFKMFQDEKDLRREIANALASIPIKKYSIPDYLIVEENELQRIRELYVPPQAKYRDAQEILESTKFLVIVGPPHVGKTSMAYFLFSDLREKHNLDVITRCTEYRDIDMLLAQRNIGILVDDPFGKIKFESTGIGAYVDEIYKKMVQKHESSKTDKPNENFIVVTSRENVFKDALINTRVNEIPKNQRIQIIQEGDYSTDDLTRILDNHLNYYLERKMINKKGAMLARVNSSKIVKRLRFPHNVDFFVERFVKDLTAENLDESIEGAAKIKEEVDKWYAHLDTENFRELKFFVFTAALIPDSEPSVFKEIYRAFINELNKEREMRLAKLSVTELRNKCSVYVTETGLINFKHPSYLDGVLSQIQKTQSEELVLFMKCIRRLLKPVSPFIPAASQNLEISTWDLIHVLRVSASVIPEYSLPLVDSLIKDAKERNMLTDVFGIIGQLSYANPKGILPLLERVAKLDDYDIRLHAMKSISNIAKTNPNIILDTLKRLIKSEAFWLKTYIISDLEMIGLKNPDLVLEILEEIAGTPNYGSSSAVDSIIKIGHKWPLQVLPIMERLIRTNPQRKILVEWLNPEIAELKNCVK